jgi:hypothetical protein
MGARFCRVLLVAALLAAQQSALAHQIWHLAASTHAAVEAGVPGQPPAQSRTDRLCDFHSALSTVLGAVSAAATLALASAPLEIPFSVRALPALAVAAPAPASRGPPLSSL